jgi:hypothetical protein
VRAFGDVADGEGRGPKAEIFVVNDGDDGGEAGGGEVRKPSARKSRRR